MMPRSAPRHNASALKGIGAQRMRPGDPFYASTRWRTFRRMVLARAPMCADPCAIHEGLVLATEVHHLLSRRDRPDLAFDAGNVQALCKACHSRITAADQRHG